MLQRLIPAILWLGALIASLLPGLIALDSGGILAWSYWALAAAIVLPALLGILVFKEKSFPSGMLPHTLTFVLIFLGVYSLAQTVPLPDAFIRIFSPGSHAAWTEWRSGIAVIAPEMPDSSAARVSVAPELTTGSACRFFLMAALAWCGTTLFTHRSGLLLLLLLPSIAGAAHALIGIYQVFLFPDYTFWNVPANHPFGVFVNRNNAAMLLNLSLACSLGLLGWRLALITGFEFGQRGFSLSALLDLISDKVSLLAFICAGLSLAGILFCGSRGGLAGAIIGLVVSMGMFSHKPIYGRLLSGALVVLVIGLVLLARVEVTPRTLERFGASAVGLSESIASNQRIEHWRDTLNALPNYAITGSGFGTYRYAYLPYQEYGVGWWFVNADNLWLEWSLEGGLPVMILLLGLASLLVYCLLHLRETPDPIDHGLVTTGWFALTSIAVSQFFDFGLLLAGSAALASLIFGALLGRAAMDGLTLPLTRSTTKGRIQFKSSSIDRVGLTAAGCVVASLIFSTYYLYNEAVVDSAVRAVEANSIVKRRTTTKIPPDSVDLDGLPLKTSTVHYSAAVQHAELLAEVVERESKRLDLLPESSMLPGFAPYRLIQKLHVELDNSSGQQFDEKTLKKNLESLDAVVKPDLLELRKDIALAINKSPLAPEPRFLYLLTSFDAKENKLVENQLLTLRGYATASLETLASYASDNHDWELSTICLQRLIVNSPHRAEALLNEADRVGHPDPVAIIPALPGALERAAAVRLEQGYVDKEFLERALELLTSPLPESRSQRAERYLLLAKIENALQNYTEGDKYFKDAIEASPTFLDARLAYIASMMERGDLLNAKRYGVAMRDLFGNENYRLNQLLAQIDRQEAIQE